MAFKTWRSFMDFEQHVRRDRRFFLDAPSRQFIDEIKRTMAKRKGILEEGAHLWRAQRGHDWCVENHEELELEAPAPFGPNRMKPVEDKACEGRINSKGIPCLYLATDISTAIGETRPWIGETVSVSQFQIQKTLQIVDLAREGTSKLKWYFKEPGEDEREEAVWATINLAFSKPTTVTDDTADYVATQILGELFKDAGFDGVIYQSGLGEGFNVAIFDLQAAHPVNGFLHEVTKVKFETEQTANPWFKTRDRKNR